MIIPASLDKVRIMHPVATVVLALAVILVVAKIAGDLATRVGQPAVLGELVGPRSVNVAEGLVCPVGPPAKFPLEDETFFPRIAREGQQGDS